MNSIVKFENVFLSSSKKSFLFDLYWLNWIELLLFPHQLINANLIWCNLKEEENMYSIRINFERALFNSMYALYLLLNVIGIYIQRPSKQSQRGKIKYS